MDEHETREVAFCNRTGRTWQACCRCGWAGSRDVSRWQAEREADAHTTPPPRPRVPLVSKISVL